jgi:hypothetical protein
VNPERRFLLGWYAAVLAGVLPVLVVGFMTSALANRLVFLGWAVGVAALYVLLLRWGMGAGWRGVLLAGRLLLLVAGGAALYARLVTRHFEEFDLAFRAFLPSLYHEAATRPRSSLGLAAVLAAAGAACLVVGRFPRRAA